MFMKDKNKNNNDFIFKDIFSLQFQAYFRYQCHNKCDTVYKKFKEDKSGFSNPETKIATDRAKQRRETLKTRWKNMKED